MRLLSEPNKQLVLPKRKTVVVGIIHPCHVGLPGHKIALMVLRCKRGHINFKAGQTQYFGGHAISFDAKQIYCPIEFLSKVDFRRPQVRGLVGDDLVKMGEEC